MKFKQKSQFYQQLSRMVDSGLPILDIMSPQMFPYLPKISLVQQMLAQGKPLAQALAVTGSLSSKDLALIKASEASGKLGQIAKVLGAQYQEKAESLAQIKKKLAYPVFLLFLGGVSIPLPSLIAGKITPLQYAAQLLGSWFILLVFLFACFVTVKCLMTHPAWSPINRLFLQGAPFIGPAMASWYLEDYFMTLATMINAGVPILQATESATKVVQSSYMRARLLDCRERISAGKNLSDAFAPLSFLQQEHHLQIHSGQKTGLVDEAFFELAKSFRERNQKQLNFLASLFPKVIYFMVFIYIFGSVMMRYFEYFDQLKEMMDQI